MVREEQDHRAEGLPSISKHPSNRIPLDLTDFLHGQNLSHFPALKILSIQANRLSSITGLSALPSLEELYISHNALTSIDPSSLASNPNLRVLDISNNKIAHLDNLSHLENLEELWASSNLLDSFEEVEKQLGGIEGLETVYFEGNPLQLRGPAVYRNKVRLALPQVKQVDASKLLIPNTRQC